MPKQFQEQVLQEIEEVIRQSPDGMTTRTIAKGVAHPVPLRTLQYRLKFLVDQKRLIMEGNGRAARYHGLPLIPVADQDVTRVYEFKSGVFHSLPLSESAAAIQDYVRQPLELRQRVEYDRSFLDSYRPNETYYLTESERVHLHEIGNPQFENQPAGTYAKNILSRLLIDLSWNSSRLEGNSYSFLETERLINRGKMAEGATTRDAAMILNHKDAINFLVDMADSIEINRYMVRSLHAILASELIDDPEMEGRIRNTPVGIGGSVYEPLTIPQLVNECFYLILDKASSIDDPFEQSFFVMVHLPYLQPFIDVNKRVSRLTANIPLVKTNLVPLTFTGVPRDLYLEAILGVYELNRTELLRDVFIVAYQQSAARYGTVRRTVEAPDPIAIRYRELLNDIVQTVVDEKLSKFAAVSFINSRAQRYVRRKDRDRFRNIAENKLLSLHDGKLAQYRIKHSDFVRWKKIWDE